MAKFQGRFAGSIIIFWLAFVETEGKSVALTCTAGKEVLDR
jgi:hypothetical protein